MNIIKVVQIDYTDLESKRGDIYTDGTVYVYFPLYGAFCTINVEIAEAMMKKSGKFDVAEIKELNNSFTVDEIIRLRGEGLI